MRDWAKDSRTETFVSDFQFEDGNRLDLRQSYRTLGRRSQDDRNIVLLLHGTTGNGTQYLQSDIADHLFGRGAPLDLDRYYVIVPDAIGHGASSRPSDELYMRFPRYTYNDIVRSQHHLLTEALGVRHLRLVLGTSMGGMLTWLWGEQYPEMMDALMPIACLPEVISGRNLLFRRLLISMISSDPAYGASAKGEPVPALGLAWNLFEMMAESVTRLSVLAPTAAAADAFVRDTAERAMRIENAVDVVWEFDASRNYDPAPGLGQIKAPLLAVNFADDEINPAELGALDGAIRKVANGRAITLGAGPESRGHQTLRSAATWAPYLALLMRDVKRSRAV